MAQLKLDRIMYRAGSYKLSQDLQPSSIKVTEDFKQSGLNLLTQALFRTAKKLDLPFVTANMVGKPYFIVTLRSYGLVNGQSRAMINPQLIWCSDDGQYVEETFVYNPGETVIKFRPKKIKVRYMNRHKEIKVYSFEGRFAAYVLQAIEVLHGIPLTYQPPAPFEVAARLKAVRQLIFGGNDDV